MRAFFPKSQLDVKLLFRVSLDVKLSVIVTRVGGWDFPKCEQEISNPVTYTRDYIFFADFIRTGTLPTPHERVE